MWEFVKTKLNPHPAHGFSPTNASDRDTRAMYIIPDVVISHGADDFEVEVVESRRFVLRVNPMYTRLSADLHRSTAAMNPEEKRHVQQYVGRAKLFIANINQRRQTLFNITRCLVDQQREFLENGVRHLRPLSRAAVAQQLGVHESTVVAGDGQQVRDAAQRRGDPVRALLHAVVERQGHHEGSHRKRGQAADGLRDRGAT